MSWKANYGLAKKGIYIGAGIALGLSVLPHLLPSLLKQELQLELEPVPEELQAHVEKIATAMHVPRPYKIKVFIKNGFSNASGGSTLLPYGAVIGLSRTVLCQNESDLKSAGLQLHGGIPIDWGSHESKEISDLLIPSGDQINFVIAHELAHIQHLDFLPHSLLAPIALVSSFHLACFVPEFFAGLNPAILALLTFTVGITLCQHIHSYLCLRQEYAADRRATLCGRSYTEGGMLLMKKRIALETKFPTKSRWDVFAFKTHPSFEDRLSELESIYWKRYN